MLWRIGTRGRKRRRAGRQLPLEWGGSPIDRCIDDSAEIKTTTVTGMGYSLVTPPVPAVEMTVYLACLHYLQCAGFDAVGKSCEPIPCPGSGPGGILSCSDMPSPLPAQECECRVSALGGYKCAGCSKRDSVCVPGTTKCCSVVTQGGGVVQLTCQPVPGNPFAHTCQGPKSLIPPPTTPPIGETDPDDGGGSTPPDPDPGTGPGPSSIPLSCYNHVGDPCRTPEQLAECLKENKPGKNVCFCEVNPRNGAKLCAACLGKGAPCTTDEQCCRPDAAGGGCVSNKCAGSP